MIHRAEWFPEAIAPSDARELLWIPCISSFTDEAVYPKPAHEYRVHILAPCKQFGNDVEVRVYRTRAVKESCADV